MLKSLKSTVFDNAVSEPDTLTAGNYNLVIGLTLCWGFLANWLIVQNVDMSWLTGANFWIFLIGYFASCFLGIYLFKSSGNPVISFIGYNLVVVPFGLVVNLLVSDTEPGLVLQAIQVTGLVTAVMMLLGAAFPKFFESIITSLVIALLAVLVIEIFQIFVMGIHSSWIDFAVVLIFCGFIGYDWGRANQIPKTLDNAIDSAAALYMDIINVFVRILGIQGND